jgi:hypothetical protein
MVTPSSLVLRVSKLFVSAVIFKSSCTASSCIKGILKKLVAWIAREICKSKVHSFNAQGSAEIKTTRLEQLRGEQIQRLHIQ